TNSGVAVGGLFIVRWLAPVIVSPIAGVVADRYNRKHLLIITDLSRAVVVLGFFLVRSAGDVWLLYALSAVQLAISGFFFPARNAILPSIVTDRELGASNALTSVTWSVMLALGTGLGGLVAGGMGVYAAFAIDSLTFLVSAGFMAMVHYLPTDLDQHIVKGMAAASRKYVDGLRYLKQHADIFRISILKAAVSLTVAGGMAVVQVALAQQVFPIGKEGGISMGLLFAAVGVGTGIGPIIARIFTGDRDHPLRRAIVVGFLLLTVGVGLMGLAHNFVLLMFGTMIRGAGGGTIWVFSTQLLMQLLPPQVRGRVFATELAMALLASSAGAAYTGVLVDLPTIGLSGAMYLMAASALIPCLLWGWYITRRKIANS
ncbi:MAG: MFS transporter, partial [bacterium]